MIQKTEWAPVYEIAKLVRLPNSNFTMVYGPGVYKPTNTTTTGAHVECNVGMYSNNKPPIFDGLYHL